MTDLYSLIIKKVIHKNNEIILHIQVAPLNASDGNYFPNRLKQFFFMALCDIDKSYFNTKKILLKI